MKLLLLKSKTIRDVQRVFAEGFPHLKIEFFTRPHENKAASWSKYMIFDHLNTLAQIKVFKEGILSVSESTITGEFEQILSVRYGLFVQVFRKSMGTWLETTKTDTWTLGEQELIGKESSRKSVKAAREFEEQRANDDKVS